MGDFLVLYTLRGFNLQEKVADVQVKNIEHTRDCIAHHHEYYEIEFVLEGSCTYNIDGVQYTGEAGNLFMLKPASFHEVRFFAGAKYVTIMFPLNSNNLGFLSGLFAEKPYIALKLSPDTTALVYSFALELQACVAANPSEDNLYAVAILNCILGKIGSLINSQITLKNTSAMSHALLYIQNHFTEDISLAQISGIANYSCNYFSAQFKHLTGMSFKQYLTNMRFTFAKKLLKTTDLSVSLICQQSGFRDFSHFMTAFKTRYGMTPKQFRNAEQSR